MSRLAPTHAASAAQPRGAAAFVLIDFGPAALHLRVARDHLPFICARTPARWGAGNIVRPNRWRSHGPGGAVLWFYTGQGDRTGKRLILLGSIVLFCGPSRDARTAAGARACREFVQNHRTIEPDLENGRNASLSSGRAVLCRFCSSAPTKIVGGYAAPPLPTSIRADQHLFAGDARRNFWGRPALDLGAIEADREQLAGVVANGGNLRFFEGRSGHVGMAMSECAAKAEADQGLAPSLRKPARVPRRADREAPRVDRPGRGVAPPRPRAPGATMSAQPVFSIWIDLINRCDPTGAKNPQTRSGRNGSGFARARTSDRRDGANAGRSDRVTRVGDRGGSCAFPSRDGEALTLWAEGDHVNA